MEHFGLGESKELVNLDFLQRMPQLQHLNINSCWNIRYHLSGLRFATKLRVLKISDIVPDEVSRFPSVMIIYFISHSIHLLIYVLFLTSKLRLTTGAVY